MLCTQKLNTQGPELLCLIKYFKGIKSTFESLVAQTLKKKEKGDPYTIKSYFFDDTNICTNRKQYKSQRSATFIHNQRS